jgi:hypothetical protein
VVVGLVAACDDAEPVEQSRDRRDGGQVHRTHDSGVVPPALDTPDADEPNPASEQPPEGELKSNASLPCDVARVLSNNCTRCHGEPPMAPMALTTYAQLIAPSLRDATQANYQRVGARIHDDANPMPPTGFAARLGEADLAVLDAWIAAGAPAGSDDCDVVAAPQPSEPAFDWTQCEYDLELRAHGGDSPDDDSSFEVPLSDDHYECFNFEVPWNTDVHGLYFDPLIDDARVIHHWSLRMYDQKLAAGSHYSGSCGETLGTAPISGWTPGAPPTALPDNVGIRMASGKTRTFQLEIHYNNVPRFQGGKDRSGVRLCATSKLRPDDAVPVTLGSPCFGTLCTGLPPGRSTVTNACVSTSLVGPAHLLWTAPHMHQLGRHMTSIIQRLDGSQTVLVDADFDFRNQQRYPTDLLIQPGDSIRTTCTFENTTQRVVQLGEKTSDEMCFNFLLVWPAESMGALAPGGYCIGPT